MYASPVKPFLNDIDTVLTRYADLPLLNAAQEREADVRKWAAARSCLRLMLDDEPGRRLLATLCRNCQDNPPQVESFEPRGGFFHLRKDIVEMLPGHALAGEVGVVAELLVNDASLSARLAAVESLRWPTTLVIGLATVVLRQLGFTLKDPMADALAIWITAWRKLPARTDSRLACNLHFSVLRYLDSRDKLVVHNIRLAMKLARDNNNRSLPLNDLLQEGLAGLVRAAEKYDFRLGYRFSTYAYNWINQYIQRACLGNGSLISYPAHVSREISRLHTARMHYLEANGAEPDYATLAAATGFSLEKVSRLRQLTNITTGLDEPVGDSNDLSLEVILADPESDRFVAQADEPKLARLVGHCLDSLTPLERQVIVGRWGLQGKTALTLAQMADQLNVSREWVRQLEKSALGKLSENPTLQQVNAEITD